MGRYYYTDNGREGKFMFAVQSSNDPEYLGMHEQERTSIDYYADEDDVPDIRKKLDEQYDKLGVPTENRIYYCKDYKEMNEYEDKYLHDKVFVSVSHEDKDAMEKHKGEIGFASSKGNDYTDYEIKGNALALARVRLALNILSDIKDGGSCCLNAEL